MTKKKTMRDQKAWATRLKNSINRAEKPIEDTAQSADRDAINMQAAPLNTKSLSYSMPTMETRINHIEEVLQYFTDRIGTISSQHYQLNDKVDELIKRIG